MKNTLNGLIIDGKVYIQDGKSCNCNYCALQERCESQSLLACSYIPNSFNGMRFTFFQTLADKLNGVDSWAGQADVPTDSLSGRMTLDERKKIRKLYADLTKGLSNCHEECVSDALESLEDIFGQEFFNKE